VQGIIEARHRWRNYYDPVYVSRGFSYQSDDIVGELVSQVYAPTILIAPEESADLAALGGVFMTIDIKDPALFPGAMQRLGARGRKTIRRWA
jgi:hypothetical protein